MGNCEHLEYSKDSKRPQTYKVPSMVLMQVFFGIMSHSHAPKHIQYKVYEGSDDSLFNME